MFDTHKIFKSKNQTVGQSNIEICFTKVIGNNPHFSKKQLTVENVCEGSPEPNSSVYADRMNQWDYKKYSQTKKNVFGNMSDYFNERTFEQIEKFLCEYFGKPVQLYSVIQTENRSTGYPIFCFRFFDESLVGK